MTQSAHALDLARLDEPNLVTLDPQIFAANLAALRVTQPELAEQLARAALPSQWRAVVALDGWLTFRTERAGEPPTWLAGTAVPAARADALLAAFRPADYNPTLPALGAGAELCRLLALLPEHRAVYVFEAQWDTLAAVLRAHALSSAIAAGRCVLIPPGDEQAFLERLLTTFPGLLPPGNIIVPRQVSADRVEAVRQVCERVARHVLGARAAKLTALQASAPATRPAQAPAHPRLGILALTPDRTNRAISGALAAAARRLGWDAVRCALDGPRDVHVWPHAQALADLDPDLILCVGHSSARPPLREPQHLCEWVTSALDVPPELPRDNAIRLAASPRIAAALRAAAPTGAEIREWYWGCEPGDTDEIGPPDNVVLLVADYPDDRPEACGIEQPSHKQLWKFLQQMVTERWETEEILHPAGLLARAQRAAGASLGETRLRSWFERLIEHALIPAAVVGRIAQTMLAEPAKILAIGQGWKGRAPEIETLAPHFLDIANQRATRPRAAVFAASGEPLTPALLQAGVRGWPLLIHSPGGRSRSAALGHILSPDQHYQAFAGRTELRAALRLAFQQPERMERRARRAQQHLQAQHSYERRLAQLEGLVQAQAGPPPT